MDQKIMDPLGQAIDASELLKRVQKLVSAAQSGRHAAWPWLNDNDGALTAYWTNAHQSRTVHVGMLIEDCLAGHRVHGAGSRSNAREDRPQNQNRP